MTTTNERDARLGRNLAAGVASTAWTAVVTICTVPIYLHYLGVEAYGLIGFYTALQGVFAVLDLGLSQSMNREVARATSDEDRARARDLLHTLALGYWLVAVAIGAGMWLAAPWISQHWLRTSIDAGQLSTAIALIGLTVACRFPLGLYLGALIGARRMGLASGIEIGMVTIANVGVIGILAVISPTIQAFFLWQAAIATINLLIIMVAAWSVVGERSDRRPRFDLHAVQRIWRFSAGLAVTAILGAVFIQSDKIVLSRTVSLADLGAYTLASIAARSLYVLVAPTFSAVYPQMSSMHAAGRFDEITLLYRQGTRLLMSVLLPLAIFGTIFSTDILTLWTGNSGLADSLSLVVGFLLLGTVLNGAMHFPYALQLAFGDSHLPMVINTTLLVIFVPLLVLLSLSFGIAGAAAAWAMLNLLYLFLGTWLTHRKLLPGLAGRWLSGDVGVPLLVSLVIVGGGCLALRLLDLPALAAMVVGLVLAGLAFFAIFALTPGMAEFTRRTFVFRTPLPDAEAQA